ncbi:hypothetical protein G3435_17280 [Pseudomonas sp. MAFF212428]|uniref:Chemotaxis protein n=1 Tax=Pseudomonas brassicae TaxID=2708063 RepID=A0A6M0CUG7_9PSED|nr:hypothetical protein [Pseudomonas brassicae]
MLAVTPASGEVLSTPLNSAEQAVPTASEGVRVNLSAGGMRASKSNGDKDIEESGLPDTIQKMLKMIRKLQKELAEKMEQLNAVMRDDSLSPEEMRQRVSSLQGEITTLAGALTTANAALAKAMKQQSLSPDQVAKVLELLAAK